MTSVIALVQEFCGKKTLPVPTAVVGSTDTGIIQIRYLLTEVVRELSKYSWQQQKVQKNWNTVLAEDQGLLTTIFGPDYQELSPGTMWNLTLDEPVEGPLTDVQWAAVKAIDMTGPEQFFKITGNHLRLLPVPVQSEAMYVIYQSAWGVMDGTTKVPKEVISADSDIFLLPDILVHRSLDYRWKRAKGEPWESDFNEYRDLLAKELNNGSLPVLALDHCQPSAKPGIIVPSGSWMV
jgi:hypothetical protein